MVLSAALQHWCCQWNTPLVKIPISPEKVTLADFKNVLNRPNYKFFFKTMDDDFRVEKEEIVDDTAHLPCFDGRVVSSLVSAEGTVRSDGGSQCTDILNSMSKIDIIQKHLSLEKNFELLSNILWTTIEGQNDRTTIDLQMKNKALKSELETLKEHNRVLLSKLSKFSSDTDSELDSSSSSSSCMGSWDLNKSE